jgi:hypothetical protein
LLTCDVGASRLSDARVSPALLPSRLDALRRLTQTKDEFQNGPTSQGSGTDGDQCTRSQRDNFEHGAALLFLGTALSEGLLRASQATHTYNEAALWWFVAEDGSLLPVGTTTPRLAAAAHTCRTVVPIIAAHFYIRDMTP